MTPPANSLSLMTLPAVAVEIGVEYRTLHSWVERGLLKPAYPAAGTGHSARLTVDDLKVARVLARLRRAGCGMRILECAARQPDTGRAGLGDGVTVTWEVER